MSLSYEFLQPEDAALLSLCLRRVYGDTYPIPEFYDAEYVQEQLASGRLFTVVARNDAGEVVGSMSTALEQLGDVTADGSALMVDKHYRGHGAVGEFGRRMVEVYRGQQLAGLHLYALALHDLVQNQSGRAGAVVTGILPAWFTEKAQVDGYPYPEGKRIGAVTLYMPLGPLPQRRCYLPMRYREVLQGIYSRLDAPRELLPAVPVAAGVDSSFSLDTRPANGLLRLVVESIGADFQAALEAVLGSHGSTYAVLFLDIPLALPGVAVAVEAARGEGFFFGALMVDRCGSDRLRLQRYAPQQVAPELMVVATPEARSLRDFVVADSQS